jgi:hypothetical protein
MNIGFYGHSNCAYRSPESFLDIVATHYNGKIVNTGCKQGSEERILFELKKTKKLDVAIIFHCHHSALFIPESDRDIHLDVSIQRAKDLFRTDHLDSEFTLEHNPKFNQLFKTNEHLYSAIDTYKTYFYHQDLVLNRYYGALLQIDQYLSFKNINTVHVLDDKCVIPNWFKFSGCVDTEIMSIADREIAKNPFFVNCISKEGNKLIADKLINLIDANK